MRNKFVLVVDGTIFVGRSSKGLILCDDLADNRVIFYKSEYTAELSHLRNRMFDLFRCNTIVPKLV